MLTRHRVGIDNLGPVPVEDGVSAAAVGGGELRQRVVVDVLGFLPLGRHIGREEMDLAFQGVQHVAPQCGLFIDGIDRQAGHQPIALGSELDRQRPRGDLRFEHPLFKAVRTGDLDGRPGVSDGHVERVIIVASARAPPTKQPDAVFPRRDVDQ